MDTEEKLALAERIATIGGTREGIHAILNTVLSRTLAGSISSNPNPMIYALTIVNTCVGFDGNSPDGCITKLRFVLDRVEKFQTKE